MKEMGYTNFRQIHGGIINYIAKTGGVGFNGPCFVFDERIGLDSGLRQSPIASCVKCHGLVDVMNTEKHRCQNQSHDIAV
jgi:predicted sulfurtransferase